MKKFLALLLSVMLVLGALAACNNQEQPDNEKDGLTLAKEMVRAMYKDAPEATASDYQVIASTNIDNVKYDITWSVDVASGVTVGTTVTDNQITVDVDEKTETEIVYVLKATITGPDGKTAETTFNHKVPAFRELSWQEYVDAPAKSTVVVKGVITGIMAKSKGNSYNCIYLQDKDGGYYVYGMATDPVTDDKLEVGMEIRVTGARDTYSGTYEIAQGTGVVEIINSEKTAVTPADYTEAFKNAKDLKDSALVERQALLVTIKGVEIVKQTESDAKSGYFRFKLGENTSYIRISSSVCPLTKDEQTAFKSEFESHTGWIADATGVICVYDGAFYLTPVTADAFRYVSLPEKSDAEMVAYEKENLSVPANVTEDSEIDLPAAGGTYSKVAITWTSDNDCAKVDGGKLKVTLPEEETKVKLTAELKCGSVTETREFEITVDAAAKANYKTTVVDAPEPGKSYKFAMDQNKLGKTLYFTGEMDGNYLATSDKAEKAVDLTVEQVEGGYRAYFVKDGKKIYIDIYEYTQGKVGVQLTETPTCVFNWNEALAIPTVSLIGNTYYLGAYKEFATMSVSLIKYLTDDPTAVGVSQFPSHLVTVEEVVLKAETVTSPEVGKSYKFAMEQAKLGKTLYFTGEMDGNYLATSDKPEKGVDLTLEQVDGGYRAYFEKDGKKTYVDIYEYTSGKAGVRLTDTPTAVYVWNEALSIPTAEVAGGTYYLGSYKEFATMSASLIKYLTDDPSAVGVSQFPSHLVVLAEG